jgi:RNA polymerase sigma-70 factor (ECF subfamily)
VQLRADAESIHAWFSTTRWSVVLFAGSDQEEAARRALGILCETYRAPILSFARRSLPCAADAEDVTQSFFAHLIGTEAFVRFERRKGVRFRSYLLTCFKNFLTSQRQKQLAQKRGGGQQVVSLDDSENGLGSAPTDPNSPELLYEKEWASALLACVLFKLEDEYRSRERGPVYEALREHLVHTRSASAYPVIAARLQMTPESVRKEVSRMRQRYREIFCEEIAHTVSHPSEVQEEVRYLMRMLSS